MSDWANRRPIVSCSISCIRPLPAPLTAALRDMAGFRNVVVHGYETVDLRVVADIVTNRLEDLLAFAAAMRARLGAG